MRYAANPNPKIVKWAAFFGSAVLFGLVASAAINCQQRKFDPPVVTACDPPTHACDPEDDFVIRWIKVERLDFCGFWYSTSKELAAEPVLFSGSMDPSRFRMGMVPKGTLYYVGMGDVKVGLEGLCVYCKFCRRGAMLKAPMEQKGTK